MAISRKRRGSDDGGDDDVPVKRSKGGGSLPKKQKGEDGNPYWEISGKRRLQVSEFKNMTMVNIREFYEKDGKSLPGKAGINLPLEQFQTLLALLPQVIEELGARGHDIEIPSFDGSEVVQRDDDDDNKPAKSTKPKKSNIETTSDEDEDD